MDKELKTRPAEPSVREQLEELRKTTFNQTQELIEQLIHLNSKLQELLEAVRGSW